MDLTPNSGDARQPEREYRDRIARRVRNDTLWSTGARYQQPRQLPLVASTDTRPVARRYELREGETVEGKIVRLPAAGHAYGNTVVLATDTDVLAIPATAKAGWTVLERALTDVTVGDRVAICFVGWRESQGGQSYRLVTVALRDRRAR